MRFHLAFACLVLLGSRPAWANDSTAEMAAGGLTLVKSDGIAMKSEELAISVDEVSVRYVFRNETAAPITTTVAFPLPPWEELEEGEGGPDLSIDISAKNPMGFKVTVDGKPIRYQTKVQKSGREVQTTYYWTQTYPPQRDTLVEHRYRPGAGGFFTPTVEYPNPALEKELAELYCVGPKLLSAIKQHENFARTVHYILKSGANWKGPIGRFKLTLKKAHAKDKISLCEPDTRKVSPTTFVVERQDFTPTRDLRILFLPAPR
jgi:hypothetical protein